MERKYTHIKDIGGLDPAFVKGADYLGIRYAEEFLSIWQVPDLQKVVCLSINRDWDEIDRVSKDIFSGVSPEIKRLLDPIPQEVLSGRCFGALGVSEPKGGFGFPWDNTSVCSFKSLGSGEVNLIRHMGPIKNQGRRGTCVAFAGIALREFFKDRSKLSEQFLYWACKEIDGIPDVEGTWPRFALKALQETGTCEGEDWPYNPEPGKTRGQGPPPDGAIEKAARYKIIRELRFGPGAVNDIRERLLGGKGRPVVIAVPVFLSWYANPLTHRTGEIRDPLPGESPIGGHAMVVIGMNDHRRRFYLRNSWGTSWAAESTLGAGYGTISYEYIAKCAQESFSAEAKKEGKIFYFLRDEWETQRWVNAATLLLAIAFVLLLLVNQHLRLQATHSQLEEQEHSTTRRQIGETQKSDLRGPIEKEAISNPQLSYKNANGMKGFLDSRLTNDSFMQNDSNLEPNDELARQARMQRIIHLLMRSDKVLGIILRSNGSGP